MNYLTELIVRPQRNVYNLKDLGDSAFSFSGQDFKRLDFTNGQIRNTKGHKISCSLWCPLDSTTKDLATSPLIIYCHGNAGNKIDIIEVFEFLLWEFNICSFDFSGAGFSEGEYVTLGYYEKYDIQAVVEFLRSEFGIKNIILYGRSMGAVSSLRYCEMDPNIKAAVLDSPFCNFPLLCEEILSNKFFIPGVMSRYLISSARKRLLEKVEGFDIENFIPANNAKKVKVPTLLIHGKSDELVHISHSREIYNKMNKNTYKLLLEVEGLHNDTRPVESVNTIRDFIMQYSYDALILKEHRRRLNIKNAHLSFKAKYSLDINSIVDNFRMKQENSRNSLLSTNNNLTANNNNLSNNNTPKNFLNYKQKQEISKANFAQIQLDEEEVQKLKLNISNYQSEAKREHRRLNNFKLDINLLNANKTTKIFSKKIKNFIKSKSMDNSASKKNSSQYLFSNILKSNENNRKSTDIQTEQNFQYKKRTNSFFFSKNDKFYASTLFKEDNFWDIDDDHERSFFFDENQNNKKSIFNNNCNNNSNGKDGKMRIDDFDLYEENRDLLNEFSKGSNNNHPSNEKSSLRNSAVNNYNNSNKINNNIDFEAEFDLGSINSHKKSSKHNEGVFAKNKNYFNIENCNDDYEKNYNKTFCLDDKAKDHIDTSFISTQETNNYTEIQSDRGSINFGSVRGKLKTRRNQVLSGILNCDVKVGSSQITITDLDKTSLRKGRGSICNTTLNVNEETIKEDKNEN